MNDSRRQPRHDVPRASGRAARHAGGDAAQGATHLLRGGASRVREVHGGDPREERAELGLDCGEGET